MYGESAASKHPEDRALVQRVLAGDPGAKALITKQLACIPNFVRARTGQLQLPVSDEDVREITQETVLALWQKLASFEGRSSLKTWVYGFCVFQVLRWGDRRQRSNREQNPHEQEALAPEPRPVPDYAHLHVALSQLPSEEQIVVYLKHFEGLTFRELGGRLEIGANTAKTRYYRGLRRLSSLLGSKRTEDVR